MLEALVEYGFFLLRLVTVAAIFIVVMLILAGSMAGRKMASQEGHLRVRDLNRHLARLKLTLAHSVLGKAAAKKLRKEETRALKDRDRSRGADRDDKKAEQKTSPAEERKTIFVLDFKGDIRASSVGQLAEEINAVLLVAKEGDQVVLRLESSGGMVHAYGLAAAQLDRIGNRSLELLVCVDRVAASGGYMMACTAGRIIAAPFAVVGSVGVVGQVPNFHRVLKEHHVDYELHTAGGYKRTLSLFGENTDEGREKFIETLEETHELFKRYVQERRSAVDIEKIATGETWFGLQAKDMGLVDEVGTSDDYLVSQADSASILEVSFMAKSGMVRRLGMAAQHVARSVMDASWHPSRDHFRDRL